MDTREDMLVALVGLLSACMVSILIVLALTWFSGERRETEITLNPQSCLLHYP
ncbi:MAG: hypothetical protein XXXJIFNMEKO3_01040 [Candidatus Erwinia impunctatus]|nr:hypothetical protein XXXJIFNMEKO_01040 [Culicoides impunctatus]